MKDYVKNSMELEGNENFLLSIFCYLCAVMIKTPW